MLTLKEVTHKPEYLPAKVRKQANKIANKYSRWMEPQEIRKMYDELEDIGVSVGAVYNDNKTAEVYYNGVEVVNSKFVYSVYKDRPDSTKVEFNIYFS